MIDIGDEIRIIANHPRGVLGRLSDIEARNGFVTIAWGAEKPVPFLPADWYDGCITVDEPRKEIRIVAIWAQRRREGAFHRLLGGIWAAGYSPVVVQPIGPIMPVLLRRWGWENALVEHAVDVVEEWRYPGAHTTARGGPR